MPVKKKSAPVKRKTATKRKAVKAAPKKPVRKKKVAKKSAKKSTKKTAKHLSTLERIETALMTGAVEFDELALDMGLLGAAGPAPKKKRKKTRKKKARR